MPRKKKAGPAGQTIPAPSPFAKATVVSCAASRAASVTNTSSRFPSPNISPGQPQKKTAMPGWIACWSNASRGRRCARTKRPLQSRARGCILQWHHLDALPPPTCFAAPVHFRVLVEWNIRPLSEQLGHIRQLQFPRKRLRIECPDGTPDRPGRRHVLQPQFHQRGQFIALADDQTTSAI